ncbi:MAG TPA: platelet-activating factor acetylhydrolase IB subunit [Planctomycetaceae bacterium]|jgi:lysophospholipase L1-like esterase|nr:platelet-activating factor acetylhydrolase IB subunit [Planctomycetaceae bacterium]
MPHRWRPKMSWVVVLSLLSSSGVFASEGTTTKTRARKLQTSTTTPVARSDKWWAQRQEKINANVGKGDAQLLMIGDSITQGWEGNGAREVWKKYYGNRHAVNLGIGGDQTQHVLWRLEHGNVDGIHPKLAVLMIGTNNSASNTPEQIAAGVKAIVEKLRSNLPATKVLVLAIFPRGPNPENRFRKVNEATNEIISKLADNQNVFYLDIGKKFLQENGTLSKDIMPDLLHLSSQGYEIWGSSIEPTVARLMAEKE